MKDINNNKIDDIEEDNKLVDVNNISTIKELQDNFYIIPKDIKLSTELFIWLEENNSFIDKELLNSNIVKRGKMKKKLSNEQIQEIKLSNKTNAELGKIYNVSASTISAVKNNKY